MIEIQELTFKYKNAKKNALQDITLKVEDGDFIGIIGESGAGKTTFCSILNGLIPHHYEGDFYGSVKIDDIDTFDTKPDKLALKVGSVFQDIESQIISQFVEEEILFGLENFGVPADQIEQRIVSALDALGIGELRHREISSLSGGQKQKVVIAAILALEPDILVLDEPTGELDPASSFQIFTLLKKLNEEKGITIIIAEQKIMLLCEFVKKLLVLEEGKMVHLGEIRDTLTHQREMEEAGINCPRVVTLTSEMKKQELIPDGLLQSGSTCLNAKEAAELIQKCLKKQLNPIAVNENETVSIPKETKTETESEHNQNTSFSQNQQEEQEENDNSSSNAAIEFKNVCFAYNEASFVKNINLTVQKGDFISLIGTNGAGKTTFSKLCNGLIKPDSGDVFVLGKNTKNEKVSSLAKHIGFLFQNPDRQICCDTVKKEITFSLKNNGLPAKEIEERVNKIISDFGFSPDTEPFNMSRGQRQHLCLAGLIALNPEILVLDEPTTGLDYRECMYVMQRIKELNEQGTTVIMVCHDMEVVLDFANKVAVMDRGQILAVDETRKVFANRELMNKAHILPPQIAETAMLLGKDFSDVFTTEEMIARIKEIKSERK